MGLGCIIRLENIQVSCACENAKWKGRRERISRTVWKFRSSQQWRLLFCGESM